MKATDRGNPAKSGPATVNVAVNDLNDNTPTFTSNLIEVNEAFAVNKAIKQIQGTENFQLKIHFNLFTLFKKIFKRPGIAQAEATSIHFKESIHVYLRHKLQTV